jgi:predicted nucleic acid-binding protein
MGLKDLLKKHKRIAIDTNIFISVFAQEPLGEKVIPIMEAAADKGTHELVTSVLAFSECAVRPYREGNWQALDQVKLMFQMPNLNVYPMDAAVAEEAARLRAFYNCKMPDAIIVATAIVHNAEVFLTNNHRLTAITEIPVVTLDTL